MAVSIADDDRSERGNLARLAPFAGCVGLLCVLCPNVIEAQDVGLCRQWEQARPVGQLDPALIREASGLAASLRFPNRLYHVADSSARIYVTDATGRLIQAVSIVGPHAIDVEDLALGPCDDTTCLFVADIGDNRRRRESVEVLVVKEEARFDAEVRPWRRIRLRYPDGPKDAEALAVRPNGDILMISRDLFPVSSRPHAELFRLRAEAWVESSPDDLLTLEHLAPIELRPFASELPGRLVSGMDISQDGRRMLVLTYAGALEFELGSVVSGRFAEELAVNGQGVRPIPLVVLPQQEGVAYLSGARAFLYTTEAPSGRAPIMRVDCVRAD